MQLEALRMAYDEIKRGEDVQLHRDVALKINGRLGPRYGLDQAWVDTVSRRAEQRKEKLENELNGYRVRNLGGGAGGGGGGGVEISSR
jgi:COP9 signalosome complex subunit 1